MLLQNACKHHQKYVRKNDENCPNMVPKPLQNRSWRGSGGHLEATLETRCFQDLIFDDFGSILGPPLGPVWGHFGHNFFDVFLKRLFEGFGLNLGSQKTSKMRPQSEPKPTPDNHLCVYLQHFSHFQGCWKSVLMSVCLFLMNPLWGRLWEAILLMLAHLLGPFWRPCWSLLGYHFCIDF